MYNKTVWKTGDIIPADKMNNIENGIGANDIAITDIKKELAKTIKESEKGVANGVAPLNKDGVLEIKYGGTFAKDSQTALYNLGARPNKNLIINGSFDIWQRGGELRDLQGNIQYFADMWNNGYQFQTVERVKNTSPASCKWACRIISNIKNNVANYPRILQFAENIEINKKYTVSAYIRNINAGALEFFLQGKSVTINQEWQFVTSNFILDKNYIEFGFDIQGPNTTDGFEITGIKFEEGDKQTNAYLGKDGIWHQFEPSYPIDELLKCQKYLQVYSSAETRPNSYIDCRPVMRKPDTGDVTQGTIVVDGVTRYYNSAEIVEEQADE